MILYLQVLAVLLTAAVFFMAGKGIGVNSERRRFEREQEDARLSAPLLEQQPEVEEPAGRHSVGTAPGSSAQRALVKGAITQQFDAITENAYTPDELDRIRSTT